MREEWLAHLDVLPGGLSKLGAAAGFLLSTFWGFRRYREDETPIEIQERIAFEVALALNQERERVRNVFEGLRREAETRLELANEKAEKAEKLWRAGNRTELVKRRIHGRFYGLRLTSGYKTTRQKASPIAAAETRRGKTQLLTGSPFLGESRSPQVADWQISQDYLWSHP